MDYITIMMQKVIIDNTYYDSKVEHITKLIYNQSFNQEYVNLCYDYIIHKLSTDIYCQDRYYDMLNIKTPYQIIFFAYQLIFISEYTTNYNFIGQLYCPDIEKICRKMDELMCIPDMAEDIIIHHDNMLTSPQEIKLGDDFFENIKQLFCNSQNQYNMFISPHQTIYDSDGFIIDHKFNFSIKKFTWIIRIDDFFDFIETDYPKIIYNYLNPSSYTSLMISYEEIKN